MRILTLTAALSIAAVASVGAPAASLTTLYTFTGGADGSNPGAALVPDRRGGFFGTTCPPTWCATARATSTA